MSLNLNGAKLEEVVHLPAKAGTSYTFQRGDMLYWDTTNLCVRKLSDYTWATSTAATRRAVKQFFVGVSLDSQFSDSPARLIPVATYAEIDVEQYSAAAEAVGTLYGPAEGYIKIANGTFTGNADGWILGDGWAYGTNAADHATTAGWLTQNVDGPVAGKTYIVSWTISSYAGSGNCYLYLGGVAGTARSSAATFSETITVTDPTQGLRIYAPAAATITVDAISMTTVEYLADQVVTSVANEPNEAIGHAIRVYTGSVTTAKIAIQGAKIGAGATRIADARTLTIFDGLTNANGDILTAATARQLFGGAVELLAWGAVVQTALGSTTDLIAKLSKNTSLDLAATLTVPKSSARGYTVEADCSGDASGYNDLAADDTLSITQTQVSNSGAGAVGAIASWYIRYRRLD